VVRVVLVALLLLVFPAVAHAAACPGADSCPYGGYASVSQDGGGAFRQPQAVAVTPSGDVYVADRWSYMVQRFSPDGTFLGEFGEHGAGDGQFGAIGGIAFDSSGDVYVLDTDHNRVEKFTAGGSFVRQFGSSVLDIGWKGGIAVSGNTVFVSNSDQEKIARFTLDGAALSQLGDPAGDPLGGLAHPLGLAVSGGDLYVADDQNNRVVEMDLATGNYVASAGGVTNAYDVGVDGDGNVWVVDNTGDRVMKLGPGLAGTPAYFSGAGMNTPRAVAVTTDGHVYVADTLNEQVQELDPTGAFVTRFGVNGRNFGNLTGPEGLALTPDGHLVIADTLEYAMQELNPDDTFFRRYGDHVKFNLQTNVATDAAGNMYVADTGHNKIQKWDAALDAPAMLGTSAGLAGPEGVAVDAAGDMYVADTGNGRIVKLDPAGNAIDSFGGFEEPSDVAVAASDLYVTDSGSDRVYELSTNGPAVTSWGGSGSGPGKLDAPHGLGLDSEGNVYVADSGNERVERFGPSGTFLDAWGVYGHGAGEFDGPSDVAVTPSGDAFVSDTFNNRLERFSFGGGTVAPNAAPPPPPPATVPKPRRLGAPRLSLKVSRRQRVLHQRGVKITLSCASTCRTTVKARGFHTLTVTLHAKHVTHRKLALTKAERRKLARALKTHTKATLTLKATVQAAQGPSASASKTIRVTVTG
jgi:sugar lactone lactonase YvrE